MAAPRPWTPTERPGDASYTSPVVYHGDHQVIDSDVSSEKSVEFEPKPSPGGIEVATVQQQRWSKSKLISSETLQKSTSDPLPQVQTYQPYNQPPTRRTETDSKYSDQNSDENPESPLIRYRSPESLSVNENPGQLSTSGGGGGRYRLSQMPPTRQTDSIDDLSKDPYPQSSHGPPSPTKPDETIAVRPLRLSQTPRIENHSDLPSVTGKSTRQINIDILLINPNSTKSMTERCLESIQDSLPINVTVYGFTATRPAPTAIESATDAIMSTAACMKAILPIASKYDAFLVACYSHHPLITALREQLMQPVIGIMEASLYASRMCGSKFGIVTTGIRSMYALDSSVKTVYDLQRFSVGTESSRLSVLELESRSEEEVADRLARAAVKLQARGADCICLGCAGMTSMQKACQDAVGMHDRVAMVVDGVNIGVHFLIGLVRENLGTAKGGVYNTVSGHKSLGSMSP